MKEYKTAHLVKSEDLNHHGTLFAARTASWFVESGFVAAACEHGDPSEILCRNVHGMSFDMPVHNGEIVTFTSRTVFCGTTSLIVRVSVMTELSKKKAVEGYLTFVITDKTTGRPKAHGITLDEATSEEELIAREEARKLRER